MIETVLDWIKSNLGKNLESPRKNVFKEKRATQDFKIVKFDEEKRIIKIQFINSGRVLPLEFWRFEKAIEIISDGEWVRLGTSLDANDSSTLEWKLQEYAKKKYGRKTDTKTAPHICDILVLSGIAKYGYAKNPITKRKNQAIKKI